jgi:hypothetical protein
VTPKTVEALQRLHANVDFQEFLKHLEGECEVATAQFIASPESELQVAQGRVQSYKHIIGTIRHVKV